MATQALYLEDCYLKEFEAKVVRVEGKFVVLDKTAFYPSGGGQPHDTGVLEANGQEFKVVFVKKFPDSISHEVYVEGLKEGDAIKGKIDWQRRHLLMRMHTASHLLASRFHKNAGALITGNQLNEDKSRIDFSLENFDREKINDYIDESNKLIEQDLPIKIYWLSKEEVLQNPELVKLAKGLLDIEKFRIVEIVGADKQADGGCHVKSLREIGKIEFLKAENKGKSNRRVYFTLR